jgi:hypothetical protein
MLSFCEDLLHSNKLVRNGICHVNRQDIQWNERTKILCFKSLKSSKVSRIQCCRQKFCLTAYKRMALFNLAVQRDVILNLISLCTVTLVSTTFST